MLSLPYLRTKTNTLYIIIYYKVSGFIAWRRTGGGTIQTGNKDLLHDIYTEQIKDLSIAYR